MDLQFLKYIPTPGEKAVGIAVIRMDRKFIFRFRILPSEQGGYWITTAAMKTGVYNGKDKYEDAFQFDSTYEKDEVHAFVLQHVEAAMQQNNPSVFHSSAQQPRPVANHGYNSGSVAQGHTQQNQNSWGNAQQPAQSMDETLPF